MSMLSPRQRRSARRFHLIPTTRTCSGSSGFSLGLLPFFLTEHVRNRPTKSDLCRRGRIIIDIVITIVLFVSRCVIYTGLGNRASITTTSLFDISVVGTLSSVGLVGITITMLAFALAQMLVQQLRSSNRIVTTSGLLADGKSLREF